jgi:hypothetical protein
VLDISYHTLQSHLEYDSEEARLALKAGGPLLTQDSVA